MKNAPLISKWGNFYASKLSRSEIIRAYRLQRAITILNAFANKTFICDKYEWMQNSVAKKQSKIIKLKEKWRQFEMRLVSLKKKNPKLAILFKIKLLFLE